MKSGSKPHSLKRKATEASTTDMQEPTMKIPRLVNLHSDYTRILPTELIVKLIDDFKLNINDVILNISGDIIPENINSCAKKWISTHFPEVLANHTNVCSTNAVRGLFETCVYYQKIFPRLNIDKLVEARKGNKQIFLNEKDIEHEKVLRAFYLLSTNTNLATADNISDIIVVLILLTANLDKLQIMQSLITEEALLKALEIATNHGNTTTLNRLCPSIYSIKDFGDHAKKFFLMSIKNDSNSTAVFWKNILGNESFLETHFLDAVANNDLIEVSELCKSSLIKPNILLKGLALAIHLNLFDISKVMIARVEHQINSKSNNNTFKYFFPSICSKKFYLEYNSKGYFFSALELALVLDRPEIFTYLLALPVPNSWNGNNLEMECMADAFNWAAELGRIDYLRLILDKYHMYFTFEQMQNAIKIASNNNHLAVVDYIQYILEPFTLQHDAETSNFDALDTGVFLSFGNSPYNGFENLFNTDDDDKAASDEPYSPTLKF